MTHPLKINLKLARIKETPAKGLPSAVEDAAFQQIQFCVGTVIGATEHTSVQDHFTQGHVLLLACVQQQPQPADRQILDL